MYDRLIIDSDFLCFESASLGEERSINVIHKASGHEKIFKTRTEFWGHHLKKAGGWLGEQNKERKEKGLDIFVPDDFEIIDVQTPLSFGHVVNVINTRMNSIMEKLECTNVSHYVSGGDSWRIDASTLIKYKGNREGGIRPIWLEEAQEYVITILGGERVTDKVEGYNGVLEVDDKVVMEWYADKKSGLNSVVVATDKDNMGTGVLTFNPDKMDTPLDTSGLGKLWIDDKKAVRGYGRKWFYHQCLAGDNSDHYFANCMSDVKWGEKSSYNLLSGCHSDKECLVALVEGYKQLYPEPKTVMGWRGDNIEIDYLYVLKENVKMAHMLRWEDDFLDVEYIMTKLGVNYD